MFTLYSGNDIALLADHLAVRLRKSPPLDPLDKPIVVVQSMGMARWLSLALAERNGLCAHIDFMFPGKFLYQHLFQPMSRLESDLLLPEVGHQEIPFAPDLNVWPIFRILEESSENPDYAMVQHYIAGSPLKRWQIAAKIAGIFDRYMTYRPMILAEWEKGKCRPDEAWQADLWRKLIGEDKGGIRHFSGLYQRLMERSRSGNLELVLGGLRTQGVISVFGFSALPPVHLEMLLAAAGTVDLDFYWFNPSSTYWGDGQSAKRAFREHGTANTETNALLGSLGRRGREFFNVMMEYTEGNSGMEIGFRSDFPETLLGRIQADIQENLFGETEAAIPDSSLEIHNCFSPLRETEALYDLLLNCFGEDETLLPKDVVVYLPDVEGYAPYIDSVFGAVSDSARRIPYTIADRSLSEEYPEFRCFLSLLALRASRLTISELLSFLSLPSVRRCFGMNDEALETLRPLLKKAGAAWGIDADFREKICGVPFEQNSLRFALERMLLGTVMSPDDPNGVIDIGDKILSPLGAAAEVVETAGAFSVFCEAIFALYDRLQSPMCGAEWTLFLESICNTFFAVDDESEGLQAIRRTLSLLSRHLVQTGFEETILAPEVIFCWMKEHAVSRRSDEKFCRGRVTFCRFQPMRSIPVRIVAMLGMNDGSFPRPDSSISFDMMLRERYPADGSVREDDRFAFLEAVLSAREKLLITYTGQSDLDCRELPPSVLIAELCDALNHRFKYGNLPMGEAVTIRHPLHPFGRDYFKTGHNLRLRNFSSSWFQIACSVNGGGVEIAPRIVPMLETPENLEISLEMLKRFFKDPCRYFTQVIVGAEAGLREPEEPKDEEPEGVSALEAGEFRKNIFDALRHGSDAADILQMFCAEGVLPPEAAGEQCFHTLFDSGESLWSESGRRNENESRPVTLSLGRFTLNGMLDGITPSGMTRVIFYPVKPKYLLETMIDHAVFSLMTTQEPMVTKITTLFSPGEKEGVVKTVFEPLTPERAQAWLLSLLELWTLGQRTPLLFDPALGAALIAEKMPREGFEPLWENSSLPRYYGDFPEEESSYRQALFENAATVMGCVAECAVKAKPPPKRGAK